MALPRFSTSRLHYMLGNSQNFWQRSFLPQLFSYLYQCRWELCKDSCPVAYLPMESRGSRVTGGHFLPVSIFRFVHCYSGCSKIAFQLAQIYSYLVWNVTFWGNWPLEECEGGLKGVSLAVVWGKWCWFRKEVDLLRIRTHINQLELVH